jgi:uncharacterized glyoxalase superfamily protein PhnB
MRYRDVAAAADWLCTAFGFEKQTVLTDETGATLYAQLTFGRALLMLAPLGDTPIEKFMKQPDEIGGAETQSCYFVVPDADAHSANAEAAGAEIVLAVEDDDFGGRGYTCRDPEGHIWTFGTYDPWQGRFPQAPPPAPPSGPRALMLALTGVLVVGVGVAAWYGGALTQSGAVSSAARVEVQETQAPDTTAAALEAAEQAAREARAQLERERLARASADKASEEALKRAAEAQQARDTAERTVKEARVELERATRAAQTAGADALKRAEEASRASEAAERAAKEARAELERERATKAVQAAGAGADVQKRLEEASRARETAERGAKEARAELQKVLADKAAAEMAKDFALGRAEEEQLAREAAEKAAKEARAELEQKLAAAKPAEGTAGPEALKRAADLQKEAQKRLAGLQKANDEAQKRAADALKAKEAAERAADEAREDLARERAAKTAAWKAITQLRRQVSQLQNEPGAASTAGDGAEEPPAKKPRPRRLKKKAEDPEQ